MNRQLSLQQLSLQRLERSRDFALVGCLVIATVANFLAHRQFYFEDAFITFRYADHLAQGLGMVFNPGERVLGTSSALYTLLLAMLSWIGIDVVDAGGLVYAACLSATGYIVARHLGRCGYPNAGVAFALMAVWGVGGTFRFFGMETALYMLLIVASVSKAARATAADENPWGLGVLLGLTCLTRYDGMVVAFVIGLFLWARRRRPPWSEAFIATSIFGIWLLFAWLYFGSPLPNTLGAKAGDSSVVSYLAASWRDLRVAIFSPLQYRSVLLTWPWRFALLALLALPTLIWGRRLVSRQRSLWMWPGITVLLLLGYALIGPPKEHSWYQMPSLYCLLAFLVAAWGEGLRNVPKRWTTAIALFGLLISALAIPFSAPREGRFHQATGPPGRIPAYRQFADWILQRNLSDTSILTHEPGFLTFHSGQRAIDAAGLVSRDIYFHGPRARRSGLFELIDRFAPDFLVLRQDHPSVLLRLEREYLKVSNGMPELTLFMRRSLYEDIASTMQQPWLEIPQIPAEDSQTAIWRANHAMSGKAWRTQGQPFDSGPGTGIAWSAQTLLDSDEISFELNATSPATRLQLLVDGAIVWELDHRGRLPEGSTRVLAVYPWKGRQIRLRLWDADPDGGKLRISNLRLHHYASSRSVEDFESSTARDFWRPQAPSAPESSASESAPPPPKIADFDLISSNESLGVRFGFQKTQGRFVTSTLGSETPVRRFSQPFLLTDDRMQMMVYDLAGAQASISLWVDGERVRYFKGTESGQLRMVRWGVKAWRGKNAVLQIRDDDGETARGLAIDALLLYSY